MTSFPSPSVTKRTIGRRRKEGPPVLLEQFTFQHVKLNVGFRDAEFQRDYADYRFRD